MNLFETEKPEADNSIQAKKKHKNLMRQSP